MSRSKSGLNYAPAFNFFAVWLAVVALVLCGLEPPQPSRSSGDDNGGAYGVVGRQEGKDMEVGQIDAEMGDLNAASFDLKTAGDPTWTVVGLSALVLGLYVGVETGFGGYLLYFAHEECGLSQSDGQFLTSVYWGFLAIGRCLAIPLSQNISPVRHLTLDLVLSVMSAILLVGGQCAVIWPGAGLLGLGLASVFPTVVSMVEGFVDVSGKMSSVFIVGAAAGEMAIPFAMGYWTAAWHPGFLVATVSALCLCAVSCVALVWFGETTSKSRRSSRGCPDALPLEPPKPRNFERPQDAFESSSENGLELKRF
jgi:hypothetical protein